LGKASLRSASMSTRRRPLRSASMSTKSQPLGVVKKSTPQFFALFSGIKEKRSNMCYEIQKLRVEIVETNSLILLLIAIKAVRKVVTSNHDDGTK